MDCKAHAKIASSVQTDKKDAKITNITAKTYEEFLAEINGTPSSTSSNRTSFDVRSGDEFILTNESSTTLTTTDEEFTIMENALTNLLSSKQQIEFLKKERNSLVAVYQSKINEQNEQIKYLQMENQKLKNSINSIKQQKNSSSSSTVSSANSCNSSSNCCYTEAKNKAKTSIRNNDLFSVSSSSPNSNSSSSNDSLQKTKQKNEFPSRLLSSSSSSTSSSSSSTEADESECFEHYLNEIMRQLERALSLQTNIHKEYFKLQEELREQQQQQQQQQKANVKEENHTECSTKNKSNNSNSILNIINEIKDINRQINTTTLGTRTTNANQINNKTNANNANNNSFFTTSNSWIFNNMMKINHQNINNNNNHDDDDDNNKIQSESLISKSNKKTPEISTCSTNNSKNSENNKITSTYATNNSCFSMSISSTFNSNNQNKNNLAMSQRFEQLLIEQQKEQLNLFKQLNEFIHILKKRNQAKSIATKKIKTAKLQIKQQQANEIVLSNKAINNNEQGISELVAMSKQQQSNNELRNSNEKSTISSNPVYLVNSKTVEINKSSTNGQQQSVNPKPSKIPIFKYTNLAKITNNSTQIDSVGKPLRFKYLSCSTKIPLLQASNQQASSSTTSTNSTYHNYKTYTKKKAVASQQQQTTVMKPQEIIKPTQQEIQQASVVNSQTFDKSHVIVDSTAKSNENSKILINFVPVIKLKSINNNNNKLLVQSPKLNDQLEKSIPKDDDGYSTMSAELVHIEASNMTAIKSDMSKTSADSNETNSSRSSTTDEKNRDSGIRISRTSGGSSSLIDQSVDSASTSSSSSTNSKKTLSTANTFDKTTSQPANKLNPLSVPFTSKKRYCFPTLKSFSYYYNNRYYYNAHNKQPEQNPNDVGSKQIQMSLKYLSDTDISSLVNQLSAYDKDVQYNVFHLDTLYNNVDYILFNSYASDTELVYNFNRLNEKNQHFMNSNYHLYINDYFNQPYDDGDENEMEEDDEQQLSSSNHYTDSNHDTNDEDDAFVDDENQQIIDSSSEKYRLNESLTDNNLLAKYETTKSTFQNVSLAEYELNENDVDEFQFEIDNNYDFFDYLHQSSSNEKNLIEYDVDGVEAMTEDEDEEDENDEDEEWYRRYYTNQQNEDEDGLVYDEDINLILMMKQQQQQQKHHKLECHHNLSAYSSLHTLESTSYSSTCSVCGSSIESKNLHFDSVNHHHQHRHCHHQRQLKYDYYSAQSNTNDLYEKLKMKHYVEYDQINSNDQTSNLDEFDSIDIEEFVRQLNMKCNTDKSIISTRKATNQLKEMNLRAVKELTEAKQRGQVKQYDIPSTPVHTSNAGVLIRRHTINEIAATSTPTTTNTKLQHEKLLLECVDKKDNHYDNNRLNSKQSSVKNISTSINAATVIPFCGIHSDTKQYVGSFCTNNNFFVNPIFYNNLKTETSPINAYDFNFAKEFECKIKSKVFDAGNDSYAHKAATFNPKSHYAKSSNTKTTGSHVDLPSPQVQVSNKFNNDFYRLCSDTFYYGSDFYMNKSNGSLNDSNQIETNGKKSYVPIGRQSSIKANQDMASSLPQKEQSTNTSVGVSGGLTAHVNTLFDKWLTSSNAVNSKH